MMNNQKTFTGWFGLGVPPFLFGSILIGFDQSLFFGCVNLGLFSLWVFNTFNTTCRRCSYYGTKHCGLPGIIVPYLFSKKSPLAIKLWRIKLNYILDLVMILYVNGLYWNYPYLFPMVLLGSIGGCFLVYGPKKHHGLLFRLKS